MSNQITITFDVDDAYEFIEALTEKASKYRSIARNFKNAPFIHKDYTERAEALEAAINDIKRQEP
jgi:hypothetical protein